MLGGVVWLNPASGTGVLIDSVEFIGPCRVFEYETALITVLAVVDTFSVWGVFVEVLLASIASHSLSEVAVPFVITALPLQLERNRKRSKIWAPKTDVYRCCCPLLTLYEADSGPCRRPYQRMFHWDTVDKPHYCQPSLRTTRKHAAIYWNITITHGNMTEIISAWSSNKFRMHLIDKARSIWKIIQLLFYPL